MSQPEEKNENEPSRQNQMIALVTKHQRQLFSYIYTLVADANDAEDILQETNIVICNKFAEFEIGTDFQAWSSRIAWWQVRNARKKHARSKVIPNLEILEAVAETTIEISSELAERQDALQGCLQRLSERDRKTILTRYEPGGGVQQAASESGRSLQATYKALGRIRSLLFDCVENKLVIAREEA